MIDEVRSTLEAIISGVVHLQHANGQGRAFELYVMTGIGLALRSRGYDVWIRRSDGSRIHPSDTDRCFVQRGGPPTGIAPRLQGRNNASSIAFCRGHGQVWELLNGVQFQGRSGALHEIDLAIVPEAVAQMLRNLPSGGCPLGRPRVSIECKDVGTNGTADEMRAFVARLYDLTILNAHHRYLGVAGPPSAIHPDAPFRPFQGAAITFWQENRRTLNVLARRTGFMSGAATLAGYYAVEPHEKIEVGKSPAVQLMNDIADWIRERHY